MKFKVILTIQLICLIVGIVLLAMSIMGKDTLVYALLFITAANLITVARNYMVKKEK